MSSILVVDDEPLVRISISQMIDRDLHRVENVFTAADGSEALRILAAEPDIALVLLDLVMPTIDGLEFLRQLSLRELKVRVVVLSSHDDYERVREAFRLGVNDYLLKSTIDRESVSTLIDSVLARDQPEAQRHSLRSLQRGFVRELALGMISDPIRERVQELSLDAIVPPYVALALWVRDMALVRMRYDTDGLKAFESMWPEYVAESVERRKRGIVCPIEPGHLLVLADSSVSPVGDAGVMARLERQIRDSLMHYLNIEIDLNRSEPLTDLADLPEAYVRVSGHRPLLSRSVARAQAHIQSHFSEPKLTLESVSEVVGVSRTHLSSQFHKEVGTPFSEYLTRVRIEAAKQLLACTDLRVYQVAERSGFGTPEHFSRVFKKATGVSPGNFAVASAK